MCVCVCLFLLSQEAAFFPAGHLDRIVMEIADVNVREFTLLLKNI